MTILVIITDITIMSRPFLTGHNRVRQKPVRNGHKKIPENQCFQGSEFNASKTVNCGYVTECCVASTIEHNRFSIVRVCQASDDIQFPYIALLGGVIQLAVL